MPDQPAAHNNMGTVLQEQGKLEEAINHYNTALELNPDYGEAQCNLGNALKEQGKLNKAIIAYEKSIKLSPNNAVAFNNLGNAYKDQGKVEEAIVSFNRALSIKPTYATAHRNLSSLLKYGPHDTQIATVCKLLKRSDLSEVDNCELSYTYAKMMEDLGDLDCAFRNYVLGGILRKKLLSYNIAKDELQFKNLKKGASNFKKLYVDVSTVPLKRIPIFILGMPRSGTTLVEQIISNHSQVYGAGELPFMDQFARELGLHDKILSATDILNLRHAYAKEIEKMRAPEPLVTDKMPHNFLHLGLIVKAFPEAKIIHVIRDPAATCWSNFKHYFPNKELGYSCDLRDTVEYYQMYQGQMEFWETMFEKKIYHLNYELLTNEQEKVTRKLIETLGLDWQDSCLAPQENRRVVRTASQHQVRKKVFSGSSQFWRKYEKHIDDDFDGLFAKAFG